MSIIAWIIIGALAGWLASLVTGEDAKMGAMANIFIGIIGSFVGGLIVSLLNRGDGVSLSTAITGFNLTSILISTVGAIVLLGLIKAFRTNNV
jgi:uncharacterized membrane protein YeaQ/YmgE (transglycosylase-associated protein family)